MQNFTLFKMRLERLCTWWKISEENRFFWNVCSSLPQIWSNRFATWSRVSVLTKWIRLIYRTNRYDRSEARYNFRVRHFIGNSYFKKVTMAFRIVFIGASTQGAIKWAQVVFGLFPPSPKISRSTQRTSHKDMRDVCRIRFEFSSVWRKLPGYQMSGYQTPVIKCPTPDLTVNC